MSVLERVTIAINGDHRGFLDALGEARHVILGDGGARAIRAWCGIEQPDTYLLLIEWDSLDAHEQFQKSESFAAWAALLRPFFVAVPVAEHYEPLPLDKHVKDSIIS